MCFNRDFFDYEYEKNNVYEKIGIDEDNLSKATDVLLGYIENREDSIDVEVTVDGEKTMMFNEREAEHMVDVKNLYLTVKNTARVAAVVFIVCMLILFNSTKVPFSFIIKASKKVYTAISCILACLLMFALSDFNTFWTCFHKLFFRNDLWLLNPRTDRMILMVPSGFFFDLIMMIVIIFVLANVVFILIANYKSRKELEQ